MWHVGGRDHDLLFDSGIGLISLKRHVALIAQAFTGFVRLTPIRLKL